MVGRERSQFSFRLDHRDKMRFTEEAEKCGLEASSSARCLIELTVQKLDVGADMLTILRAFRTIDIGGELRSATAQPLDEAER